MNKYLAELKDSIVYSVKHPNSARKAVVAALVPFVGILGVFTTVVHTSGTVATGVAAVVGILNGAVTFLTKNEVVNVATAVETAENKTS